MSTDPQTSSAGKSSLFLVLIPGWVRRAPLRAAVLGGILAFVVATLLAAWSKWSVRHFYGAEVESVVWSPDGGRLMVSYVNGTLHVLTVSSWGWITSCKELVAASEENFTHNGYGIRNMQWSPDGRRIAGILSNRTVVFDAETGKFVGPPNPNDAGTDAHAWSPDSRRVAMRVNGDVRIWDLDQTPTAPAATATAASVPPATPPFDSVQHPLDPAWQAPSQEFNCKSLQWSSANMLAVQLPRNPLIFDMNVPDKEKRARPVPWPGLVSLGALAWSPDGKQMAVMDKYYAYSSDPSVLSLWEARPDGLRRGKVFSMEGTPWHPGWILETAPGQPGKATRKSMPFTRAVAWSKDGSRVVAACQIDTRPGTREGYWLVSLIIGLTWWDAATGKPLRTRIVHHEVGFTHFSWPEFRTVPNGNAFVEATAWSPSTDLVAIPFNFRIQSRHLPSSTGGRNYSIVRIFR